MKNCLRLFFSVAFVAILSFHGISQTDSIVFKSDNFIVGEIKSMDKGKLVVKTDYSASNFKIEWNKVEEVYSATYFLITLSDGRRFNGIIRNTGKGKVTIISDKVGEIEVVLSDIVFLNSVDKGFLNQIYASIDLGFDLTRANNMKQFSLRSNAGYLANRWSVSTNYNTLLSDQDSTDRIYRSDGGLSFKYYLPRDWFSVISINFLSNTEQLLKLRSTGNLGIGKYVVHTNSTYLAFTAGASFNNETYTSDASQRESWDAFLGTELNMFDIGDFSLITKVMAYPSLTDAGRFRTDFTIDTKYDLPLDFYIKISCSVNYDNRPVVGAPETDYVLHSGFGWKW